MSKLLESLKESQLRSLDRWAMFSVAAMGIGPLLPYAASGLM